MEKKINNILFFTGKDGTQMVFRVLFTYYSEAFKKDYAVFYNESDENHKDHLRSVLACEK